MKRTTWQQNTYSCKYIQLASMCHLTSSVYIYSLYVKCGRFLFLWELKIFNISQICHLFYSFCFIIFPFKIVLVCYIQSMKTLPLPLFSPSLSLVFQFASFLLLLIPLMHRLLHIICVICSLPLFYNKENDIVDLIPNIFRTWNLTTNSKRTVK